MTCDSLAEAYMESGDRNVAIENFKKSLELTYSTRNHDGRSFSEWNMKVNLKRKNFYLDQKKILRAKRILGAKTETEAIDSALDLVVFREKILKSLERVAGKGGVEKIL